VIDGVGTLASREPLLHLCGTATQQDSAHHTMAAWFRVHFGLLFVGSHSQPVLAAGKSRNVRDLNAHSDREYEPGL
jgi:hypothetical protein